MKTIKVVGFVSVLSVKKVKVIGFGLGGPVFSVRKVRVRIFGSVRITGHKLRATLMEYLFSKGRVSFHLLVLVKARISTHS